MANEENRKEPTLLPVCVTDYISLVIKKMGYRRKVRLEVAEELTDHFAEHLRDCTSEQEREQKAQQVIAEFGDAKLLAVLMRRAKKRCRPLWRTAVVRIFQTVGVLIVAFILYVTWFFSGKPVISVNYVEKLNEFVRPAADDSLNAAPYYERAAEMLEKAMLEKADANTLMLAGKGYHAVSAEGKQLIRQWLENNREILDLVTAGAEKPYFWQSYASRDTDQMLAVLMPHLSEYRAGAYALRLRAWLAAEEGRYMEAFADIETCYRLGRHLGDHGLLVEQLVGTAIRAISVRTLQVILSQEEIPSADMATMQNKLGNLASNDTWAMNLEAEKLCFYDEIQRCFTESRLGPSHLYLKRVAELDIGAQVISGRDPNQPASAITLPAIRAVKMLGRNFRIFFTHPNKKQSLEMTDRLYDFLQDSTARTPAKLAADRIDIENRAKEITKGNILLEMLTPGIGRVYQINYRNKVDIEATVVLLALLRYKRDKGTYPEKLDDLVTAGYIRQVPIDPFSNKAIAYRKTDGDFILYSWGEDLDDDGGEVAKDKNGKVKRWASEGDWVFWPVDKN